jgi:class I fructose-bisphosphate aldolase
MCVEQLLRPSHLPLQIYKLSKGMKLIKSLKSVSSTTMVEWRNRNLSILPVDQGAAGSSFYSNPIFLDPENRIKLALEAGCNAIVSIMGGLVLFSRKYAPKIPF